MHISHQHFIKLCGIAAAIFFPLQTFASQFSLPADGNSLIGGVSYTSAWSGDTIVTIAQKNNLGVNSMLNANPGYTLKTPLSSGTTLKVPTEFLLPPLPRRGIVINLAEMRMYYYPDGSNSVMTFPVGIGRVGKTIPIKNTSITRKAVNPTWIPPKDIRAFNRDQGIELPYSIGPGPDNPLGPYAIYLRIPTFLIHSTIFPASIGTRASFGCIRMNEDDIKQFFPLVQAGTPVFIVDMPNKVGWNGNQLYLETHPPLEEHANLSHVGLGAIINSIQSASPRGSVTLINWQAVTYLSEQRDGVPHDIGFRAQ